MVEPPHWLAGRLALVTGAGRGIGAATAEALAEAGARVVLAARNGEELEAVAAGIRTAGGQATAVPTDVSRIEDVERLFEAVAASGTLPASRASRKSAISARYVASWGSSRPLQLRNAAMVRGNARATSLSSTERQATPANGMTNVNTINTTSGATSATGISARLLSIRFSAWPRDRS